MKDKINKLIPEAIDAIEKSHIANDGIVSKEYKGYISSMGASIMQAGLLPTIAFYANDTGKKAHSSYLLDAILRLINPNYQPNEKLITYVISKCLKPQSSGSEISTSDLDFDKLFLAEEEIEDALIALKLSIRTFKIKES